jgi:o-succinylbenzoate synthase
VKLRIGIARYCRKLLHALPTPQGPLTEREGLIVTLATEEGCEGRGEAAPIYWIDGESVEHTARGLARLGDALDLADGVLVGDEPTRIAWSDGIARELCVSARAALDAASLDLASRLAGVSAAERLGGARNVRVPLNALVVEADPVAVAAAVRDRIACGYRTVKLKVGAAQPTIDLARVRAAREALDDDAGLRLDANAAWSFDVARELLSTLGPERIEYVEEPLAEPTPAALARLYSACNVPLAIDESFERVGGAEGVGLTRCVQAVVLKPARVGGPTRAVAMGRRLAESGVAVVLTDAIETGIGQGAVVHTAAALAGAESSAVGLGGSELFERCGPGPTALRACGPGIVVSV